MTPYKKLIELKYQQGVSTYELARLFPDQIDRVKEVALLDIPEGTLREVVLEKDILKRLMQLKKQFMPN